MPNGPGHHRERPDITANAPGITANSPGYHRERRRAPPRADTAERPRCFPRALPLPTANGPGHHRERCRGITANSPSPRAPVLSVGSGASHRRTALVLSAGPGVSHREQRRFFPRAPVPASFY